MSEIHSQDETYEQSYLLGDLESLGFSSIRLNEFNDNTELRNLANCIKEAFLKEYSSQQHKV
ncbi:hypothetical protein [Nitrososphaera viennensis]|uniref:Uncharacterized protein n=2 Tax=Nitrososphaera viennensis TaxID=1034015 RepID=A0A060HFU3_9ARCH|nr:hypothetical protein [Nitrososphaera viennensis]AIC14438.1 hypothetical protein NVIE_002520 [Nitrososphaera viennensis EN76]UVS69418.1 hypothetical protein NWT39_01200 [Nitrososphaera viennensis]